MNRSILLIGFFVVFVGHCAAAGALRQVKRREFIRIAETDFVKELIDEDASFWARELSAFSAGMSMSGSKKSRKSRKKEPSKGDKPKAEGKDHESARVPSGKESDSVKEDDAATAGSLEVPPVTPTPEGGIPMENMNDSASESVPAPPVGSSRTQQTTSTKSPPSTTATMERAGGDLSAEGPVGDVLVEKAETAESESTPTPPAATSSTQQTTTTQSPPSTATTTEKPGSDLSVVAPIISTEETGESATGKEPNEGDMESAKDGEKQGGSLGGAETVASAAPDRSLPASAGIVVCVIVGAVFSM